MKDSYSCDQLSYLERGIAKHLHKIRMDYLVSVLSKIKSEKKRIRVLDVGCGDGVVLKYVASICDKNDTIVGLDVSKLRLERAHKLLGSRVKCVIGNATDLKFKTGFFDIVIFHHVLEHVPNDKKSLEEAYRVLKKGGYILVGVPNEGGNVGKLLRFVHPKVYMESQHIHFYTDSSMKQLIEEAGFKKVRTSRFGFLFPFYPIHWLILSIKPVFSTGHQITQKIKFTADSLFFIAEKG